MSRVTFTKSAVTVLNSILQYRIECHSSLESYDPIRSIGSHRAPPANQKHARHRRQSVWTVECFMQIVVHGKCVFLSTLHRSTLWTVQLLYAVYFSCYFCTLFFWHVPSAGVQSDWASILPVWSNLHASGPQSVKWPHGSLELAAKRRTLTSTSPCTAKEPHQDVIRLCV